MKRYGPFVFLVGSLGVPALVLAFTATSSNFFIKQNIQEVSGGNSAYPLSTSTNFTFHSAGAQTAIGTTTASTNFVLLSGFLRSFDAPVQPVYTQMHYHWRNDDGGEAVATSGTGGAEDVATSSIPKNEIKRLRIAFSNEGGTQAAYTTEQVRLEYGEKVSDCASVETWINVGSVGGAWDMADSAYLTNADQTTNIAVATGGVTDENIYFSGTGGILDTTSESGATYIPSHTFYELEYSIQALSGASDGATYCFRVTDAGNSSQYIYSTYPESTIDAGPGGYPIASAVSIDSDATSITLTENTTKNVVCAGTVTDTNGYTDISAVGAFLFRTSVGTSTAPDDNNQYRLYGDSQCVPSAGAGNSETYTCTFAVQYFADPTDASSPNSSDDWTCEMWPKDTVATGTPATDTIEMNSLIALDVTSSISYGTVNANTDTGATNQTTTITNTGNRDMDPQLSGATMCTDYPTCSGSTIAVGQQKYSATSFTYSSGGTALTTTPTTFNLTLPQRTGSVVQDDVLWGLGVPNGTPVGTYTGENAFAAVGGI